jgi:hypothetical protein
MRPQLPPLGALLLMLVKAPLHARVYANAVAVTSASLASRSVLAGTARSDPAVLRAAAIHGCRIAALFLGSTLCCHLLLARAALKQRAGLQLRQKQE